MFALVDANSFYASCEKIFRPDLKKKPVVVLSNNDGCVIALSREAKKLGVPMGEPVFKIQELLISSKTTVFSSNFSLYSDISSRLVELYQSVFEKVEIYSIDEVFIHLKDDLSTNELTTLGYQLHKKALEWIGIPVSIGFGQTKTLAKVAQKLSKNMGLPVFVLPKNPTAILETFRIENVWGIGRQYTSLLKKYGVVTAAQYTKMCPTFVKKKLTIVGLRTQLELRGISCIPLDDMADPKQSILSSRSFGKKVTELSALQGAVTNNVMTAHNKLVANGLVVGSVMVFVATSRFEDDFYSRSSSISLIRTTDTLSEILEAALLNLERLFLPDRRYAKSGVLFLDLRQKAQIQLSLFQPVMDTEKSKKMDKLSSILSQENRKWGKRIIIPAIGLYGSNEWTMNQNQKSPRYTTNWKEVPRIQI